MQTVQKLFLAVQLGADAFREARRTHRHLSAETVAIREVNGRLMFVVLE
jgi:hypothetical protein